MNNTHITILGTCGVCVREIAVENGRLVHHGYRRPGDGQIHGDCFAVGYEPYERSLDATNAYKALVQTQRARYAAHLAALNAHEVTELTVPDYQNMRYGVPGVRHLRVGVTAPYDWFRAHEAAVREAENAIRGCDDEIGRMDRLIAEWELRELGQETRVGEKVRKEREVRNAERTAKRAVKAEKEAAKKAKQQAVADKRARLEHELKTQIEQIVEKAEATDTLRDIGTRQAVLAVVKAIHKEAKAVPRARFYLPKELDALFVRVDLARVNSSGGWVDRDYDLGQFWEIGG